MEEVKNQTITQTTETATDSKKGGKNVLMLLVLLGLALIFGLLIYTISKNNEADYVSVVKQQSVLNSPKANVSPVQNQVEDTNAIDVGDIDTDLQDLDIDLQGL